MFTQTGQCWCLSCWLVYSVLFSYLLFKRVAILLSTITIIQFNTFYFLRFNSTKWSSTNKSNAFRIWNDGLVPIDILDWSSELCSSFILWPLTTFRCHSSAISMIHQIESTLPLLKVKTLYQWCKPARCDHSYCCNLRWSGFVWSNSVRSIWQSSGVLCRRQGWHREKNKVFPRLCSVPVARFRCL